MKKRIFIFLLVLFFIFLSLEIFIGSVPVNSVNFSQVFWSLRIPRALTAVSVGAGLAVSGVLVQSYFSNPLADPFVTGIASSAALGAIFGEVFFGLKYETFSTSFFSFVFSSAFSIFLGTWIRRKMYENSDLLLIGVTFSFFFSALGTLLLAFSDPLSLSGAVHWLMGSTGNVGPIWSIVAFVFTSVLSLCAWTQWRKIDLLAVDETTARSMGVDTRRLQFFLYILVSCIVAIGVSIAGVISFVGLIVPHVMRKIGFRSSRILIPSAFFGGAIFVLFGDVVARNVLRPAELPVGVVLSFIGAPFFLYVFSVSRGR